MQDISIAEDGVVYAAARDHVVARSSNSGTLWTTSGSGLPSGSSGARLSTVAVAPSDSSKVVVGTWGAGLFVSSNSASSFAVTSGAPTEAFVESIAFAPSDSTVVYAGVRGSSGTAGLFRSTDSGSTWTAASNGLPAASRIMAVVVDPLDAQRVFAADRNTSVYLSTDGGDNWTAANSGIPSTVRTEDLAMATDDSSRLIVVTTGGVYETSNDGGSWLMLNDLDGLRHTSVVIGDSGATAGATRLVVAGSFEGLRRSMDGGATWSDSNSGLEARSCLLTLWRSSDRPQEIFCQNHRSDDGGATWTRIPIDVSFAGESSLSAPVVQYLASEAIVRSDDRGQTWSPTITDDTAFGLFGPQALRVAIHPTDEDTILVGNFSRDSGTGPSGPAALRSDDGGATFTALFTPTDSVYSFIPWFAFIQPTDPSQYLVSGTLSLGASPTQTFQNVVYTSGDGGAIWNAWILDYERAYPARAPSEPSTFYLTAHDTWDTSSTLFKSMDSGQTFLQALTTLPCRGVVAVGPTDPMELFLPCGRQVHRSTDGGFTWNWNETLDRTGLPVDVDEFLEVMVTDSPRTIVATTNAGIYTYTEALFAGGFETGDLSEWSSFQP